MVDSTNPRVMADNIKMLAANGGATVEANPEGEATADLEKLGVDGTIYGIPSIEANPEEEATADLEKLGVGGVVYRIPEPEGGLNYPASDEIKIGTYQGSDLYMKNVRFSGSYGNDTDNALMSGSQYNFIGIDSNVSWFKEIVANAYFPISQNTNVTGVNKFYTKISNDRHTIYYHPSFSSGGYGLSDFSIYVLYTKIS